MSTFGVKNDITLQGADDPLREVSNSFAQIGMVLPFIGSTTQIPPGWLWCNGDTFLQANYPKLYEILGNSNTLPDLRGDFIVGTTTTGEVKTSYGAATHSHTMIGTSPATSNSAIDAHEGGANSVDSGASASNHAHNYNIASNIGYYSASTYVNYVAGNQANVHLRTHNHSLSINSNSSATNDNHSHNFGVSNSSLSASNSHAHNTSFSGNFNNATTLIPQIAVNFIIKADV